MDIEAIVREAIREDLGEGDHTSLATIPEDATGRSVLLVKEAGVLAGLPVALKVFEIIDPTLTVEVLISDGQKVIPGDRVFIVSGKVRSILAAERTALNLMQRLSGIATQTRRITERLQGLKTKVLDTRKTTPLLRELEKYAVRIGGGENHRFGLYDMIMIKDNHVDFCGGICQAIDATQQYLETNQLSRKIEIEVRNDKELGEVLARGHVDRIILDNFSPEQLRRAVEMIGSRFETEASGGITIDNIRQYAETGVDFISVGALTHHIKSLDMSLKAIKD
ncbi:MAG: carboxylating nicotinate-nucleotide diphosphorylase [Bacteroidetes bacterium]|nr:carboxylating nicotinate-nucleotide diphosphorylase [Bacteroidota bacterium]